MTQPITIYPIQPPGIYRADISVLATPLHVPAEGMFQCVQCLQPLESPSDKHWSIGGRFYCRNCVVVADREEGT